MPADFGSATNIVINMQNITSSVSGFSNLEYKEPTNIPDLTAEHYPKAATQKFGRR